MTRHDFDALVRRIESRYAGRPAALGRATAAWVGVGQAGVLAWLAFLFGLGGAAFAGGVVLDPALGVWLLGLGVALIVYGVAQAGLFLLVDSARPDGRVLRPGEAAPLVGVLDGLRNALHCRPFGQVRVSMDFNAGVRETPRLGVFGWPRTTLEVGLPLLVALTPEEFRAVLAHEFAHLSARHGRGGHRIYRLHRTWDTLIEKLQRPASGGSDRAVRWAVTRFLDWYWPRFHARAVVLSRAQEFEADRVAADLVGAENLASALWRMECLSPWFSERFWIDVYKQASESPEPPPDVLDRLRSALDAPPEADDVARWTERGLSRTTGVDESHPAFRDRIQALNVSVDRVRAAGFRTTVQPTAAEALLGDDFEAVVRTLSADWQKSESASWRERHRRAAAEARKRPSASAEATPPTEAAAPPDTSALWESAREAADLQGLAAAEPVLRTILDRDPQHPGAAVMLGHHLITLGNAEGERLLWGVVDRADEHWMHNACGALQAHYRATGQTDRLRDVRTRLDRYDADVVESRRERATVTARDGLLPHGLTDEQLAPLRALLTSLPDGSAAWLVRKALRHFPHRPLFLLCVRATPNRWGFANADRDRELTKQLVPRVELPGQVLVVTRHGAFRKLASKIMAFPGSDLLRSDRTEETTQPGHGSG